MIYLVGFRIQIEVAANASHGFNVADFSGTTAERKGTAGRERP